jgi:hypothetical protein
MKTRLHRKQLINKIPRKDSNLYDILNALNDSVDELDTGATTLSKAIGSVVTSGSGGLALYTIRKHIAFRL